MSINSAADRSVLAGQDYERAHAQLMLKKQQATVAYIPKRLKDSGAIDVIGNIK